MNDNSTLHQAQASNRADVTDNSLITDFTQVVSCAVGNDRAERQRQKIRKELVQQYFASEKKAPATLFARLQKLFGYG